MELMGKSLEEIFQLLQKSFPLETVLYLALQMIEAIHDLHSHHIIHRDIKPENFVTGYKSNCLKVYLLDFGLAKYFRNMRSGLHIPLRSYKNFIGTPRYASISTHLGLEQSRRDDLESLAHIFIYFLKGGLPWQNLPAANRKEKYAKILHKKIMLPVSQLCQDLPSEFGTFLLYCRKMKFNQRPDYAYIFNLFKRLQYSKGFSDVLGSEWTKIKLKDVKKLF